VNEITIWDLGKVINETVCESQRSDNRSSRVGWWEKRFVRRGRERKIGRAEHKHVTNTFTGAMHTLYLFGAFGYTD
jgi:hypothetical protein